MESSGISNNGNDDRTPSSPHRKRVGRPPKNKQQPTQMQPQHHHHEYQHKQQSKLLTPEMIDSSLNECRRSSRKKIIKFDVRDLLNKNRINKTHKVQIEARIDSDVATSNNLYDQPSNNLSTDVANDDSLLYVEDIDSNSSKPMAVNSSFRHELSTTVIVDEQQQNVSVQKKRGRPPNVNNLSVIQKSDDNIPKRGRGRPPKCRNQETHVPSSVDKIITPRLSSSVSVLVKKLDLTDGHVFKVTGNNCFEKINIKNTNLVEMTEENNVDSESPAKNKKFNNYQEAIEMPSDQQIDYNEDDDEEEEVFEENEEELEEVDENELQDLERQDEEEIIYEISSSSASSNLNHDDLNDFEVSNESPDNEQSVDDSINSSHNERRQRNFACVSFMQPQSNLNQDDDAVATAISPEFIVEEIITENDNNNFIVETEEESIEDVVYEVEDEEPNTLDDSFIVIMDMNNESSSCAITDQQDDELDLVECDIENSPQNISTTSNNIDNEPQEALHHEVSTIDECPVEVYNQSKVDSCNAIDLDVIQNDESCSQKDSVKDTQLEENTNEIMNVSFEENIFPSKEDQQAEYTEMEYSENIQLNREENSAKIQTEVVVNEESKMEISSDEVIVNENANNDMDENIDNATNLMNSIVIENENDSLSFELIEVMEEVDFEEKQTAEKTESSEQNNQEFIFHNSEQLPMDDQQQIDESMKKNDQIPILGNVENQKEEAAISAEIQGRENDENRDQQKNEETSISAEIQILAVENHEEKSQKTADIQGLGNEEDQVKESSISAEIDIQGNEENRDQQEKEETSKIADIQILAVENHEEKSPKTADIQGLMNEKNKEEQSSEIVQTQVLEAREQQKSIETADVAQLQDSENNEKSLQQNNEKIPSVANLEDLTTVAKNKSNVKSEQSATENVDTETPKTTDLEIALPSTLNDNNLMKSITETPTNMNEVHVETSTLIDILRTVESNKQQIIQKEINPPNVTAIVKDIINDDVQDKLSPSPATVQRRRSDKRFSYVIEAARPKTLEETFAEIAEQSSKVVLEMAAVGNKLEEDAHNGSTVDKFDSSMDISSSEKEHKTIHDVAMNYCHNNNVPKTNSPKRRGRKPKQKIQPTTAVVAATVCDQDKTLDVKENVRNEQNVNVNNCEEYVDKKNEQVIEKSRKEEEEEIISLLSKGMQINNNISTATTTTIHEVKESNEKKVHNVDESCEKTRTSEKVLENRDEKLLENNNNTVKKEKRKSRWDEQEFRQDSSTIRKLENELAMKKERHNQLKAAFQAALSEVANNSQLDNVTTTPIITNTSSSSSSSSSSSRKTQTLINPNLKLDLTDATLPLMLYKSMTAKLDKEILKNHDNHANNKNNNNKDDDINNLLNKNYANNIIANPLGDIEQFIADGVSLLKQKTANNAQNEITTTTNYAENVVISKKQTEQQTEQEEKTPEQHQSQLHEDKLNTAKNNSFTECLKKENFVCNDGTDVNKRITTTVTTQADIVDQKGEEKLENDNNHNHNYKNNNDHDEEDDHEHEEEEEEEEGTMVFESSTKTFTMISSANMDNLSYGATLESHGDETAALRRSHRIKQITKAPKALVGRGLVRDKERFSLKDDVETKTAYSLDDHLTDLAEVEAKNAKFLKDMEERLSNFQVIKENEYKCEHLVSKEARRMICDCFLTKEEEERGELGCGEDCLNRLLMIECGPNCNVKERCTNKRFQIFLCSPCRVFRTEKKGFGIMADIEILPGEFIMEYVGEVIDGDEFERRRTAYSMEKNRHYYFMALRSDAIIDATTKGNISRFINHSCDPNAETQKWTVNGELRIGFFSRKSIMPGEEITFDYQYQRYGREAQRCYCESSNCRGWIGEEPNSDEGEQNDDDSDDDDLLGVDDDDDVSDDDSVSDPLEVQRKLEIAAAAAKLMPMSEEERHKKKHSKMEEEDSTVKFRKLLNKISEKVAKKKQEQRKARGRPRKALKNISNNDGLSPSKGRFLEDPDIEDEVNFLKVNGLKNQSDTLSLSRLMVRAKLPQTRLNLLEVLREGEEPCRRLFLDYHGLRLLHGWMNENSNNMEIRLALLKTLMWLPITNKTVLKDSKVLQTMSNWCYQFKSHTQTNSNTENNSSPSDESSKESTAVAACIGGGSAVGVAEGNVTDAAANTLSDIEMEIGTLAEKLLVSWDNLLEIFRIPKRERLEQMKEHEREADRQYEAKLEDNDDAHGKQKLVEKNTADCQQQQRDRFGRSTINRTHNNRPYSSRHNPATDFKRRPTYDEGDDMRHLSKEKRREIFAARVAREEAEKLMTSERREFEIKCRFFGLNAKRTKPHDIPFCVNTSTGQWFAFDRRPIPTPPNYRHAPVRPKYKSTNPNDYKLPPIVSQLPKNWCYGITPFGKIYYYHVKYRQSQWEPPTANQISGESGSKIESENDTKVDSTDDDEHIIKDMDEVQLKVYKEQKVEGRRRKRRSNLSTERPISPRRDEDRAYNQQEVRKYKENKEKVRKRKEEIRRRRVEAIKRKLSKMTTAGGTLMNEIDNNAGESKVNVKNEEDQDENGMEVKKKKAKSDDQIPDALPIQEYLLSSDEDHADNNNDQVDGVDDVDDINDDDVDNNSNALLYKIVEGDKIVDELDALMTTNVSLKRPLPPLSDFSLALQLKQQQQQQQQNQQPQQQQQNSSNHEVVDLPVTVSSSSHNSDKYEQKRRKHEKKEKEKSKRNNNNSSINNNSNNNNNNTNNGGSRGKESDVKLRKIREKFRCDIAGIIVHYLKPYRKSNCQRGRIKSDDDYNHLARKLTHFVMIKETKYCESVGQTLVVTESVKNKSKEFIKKYMAKYGEIYEKPNNDPEFKEIPFNMKSTHDRA